MMKKFSLHPWRIVVALGCALGACLPTTHAKTLTSPARTSTVVAATGTSAPTHSPAKQDAPEPSVISLRERLKPLAALPKHRRFPTLRDPVTDLVTTLTISNSESLLELARVLGSRAPQVKMWVLTPESFDPLNAGAKSKVPAAVAALKKRWPKNVNVEWSPHPYLQYSTPQDLGIFFWHAEKPGIWKPGFLDFNRAGRELIRESWPLDARRIFASELPLEEPLLLVDRMKSLFHADLLRLPAAPRGFDETSVANHAGNVALIPDAGAVAGSSLPAAARAELQKLTGFETETLDTEFLQDPLLSQAYALIPTASPCGFSLLAASPLGGLQVRRGEAFRKTDLDERILETVFYFAKSNQLKADGEWRPEDFDLTREPRTYQTRQISDEYVGQPRYFDFLVRRTLQAESAIRKSARAFAQSLKTKKICPDLRTVYVPVIAFVVDENEYFENENGVGTESRLQFLSPTPNLVSVGQDLIMGDFQNSPAGLREELKERTQKALEAVGVPRERQHFITSDFYNEGLGSIGGGVLVVRRPADLTVETPTKLEAPSP